MSRSRSETIETTFVGYTATARYPVMLAVVNDRIQVLIGDKDRHILRWYNDLIQRSKDRQLGVSMQEVVDVLNDNPHHVMRLLLEGASG